jgi:hypothetical protein
MQAEKIESTDRYVVKPAGDAGQWLVSDTMRNGPVFGAETLSKDLACRVARRLNEAYRQLRQR